MITVSNLNFELRAYAYKHVCLVQKKCHITDLHVMGKKTKASKHPSDG